jgi:hypothetical protein
MTTRFAANIFITLALAAGIGFVLTRSWHMGVVAGLLGLVAIAKAILALGDHNA